MNQFAQALGKNFDKDTVRTKSFVYNNHTFKVKIPTTREYETLLENANIADDTLVEKYYQEIVKEFFDNKDKLKDNKDVVFKDDDVIVKDKSMREASKNKVLTQNRILALIRLLVPEEKGFDMSTVTYDMVEELFPFTVQMEIIDLIANTITPAYKDQKGK